ncbi:MAG: hypothetical protein JO368_04235, partial [Acidimicrobiales bacterium]|nr:hypothetical protein [Acidimicrobiales bacterium]
TPKAVGQGAFDGVANLAVVATAIVGLAAVLALPSFVRSVRRQGWGDVGRSLVVAVALTVVGAAAGTGLVAWAHRISDAQRNGGNGTYVAGALVLALLTVAVLAGWTRVAVCAVRRLDLPSSVLRVEVGLAAGLTAAMGLMLISTTLWWVTLARRAPWFLAGSLPGGAGSPAPWQLILSGGLMAAATLVALIGACRALAAGRRLGRDHGREPIAPSV